MIHDPPTMKRALRVAFDGRGKYLLVVQNQSNLGAKIGLLIIIAELNALPMLGASSQAQRVDQKSLAQGGARKGRPNAALFIFFFCNFFVKIRNITNSQHKGFGM